MSDYLAIGAAVFGALLAPVTALVTQVFYKQSSPMSFRENLTFRLFRALSSSVPEPDWWRDIPVKKISITAGGNELFVDDIIEFVGKLRVHNPGTDLVVADGERHDSPVLFEFNLVYDGAANAYVQWIVVQGQAVAS